MNHAPMEFALGDAFAAAAHALALFCRLRNLDAAELPAQDVDTLLDLAFQEAARQAAACRCARRPGRHAGFDLPPARMRP